MNDNKEVIATSYQENELDIIVINNLKKRAVEFYKCTPISLEEAGELLKKQ